MRVTILPDREVREVDARSVGELLKTLGLHRDAHLVVRGQDILTSDVSLSEGDQIEVWPSELSLGHSLPTVPLALRDGPTLPLDLERTYVEARRQSRV